jgi:hypothetical protein
MSGEVTYPPEVVVIRKLGAPYPADVYGVAFSEEAALTFLRQSYPLLTRKKSCWVTPDESVTFALHRYPFNTAINVATGVPGWAQAALLNVMPPDETTTIVEDALLKYVAEHANALTSEILAAFPDTDGWLLLKTLDGLKEKGLLR